MYTSHALSRGLAKAGKLTQSTQRTLLDYLALVARAVCVSGSDRATTIGKTVVGRLPPPGHSTDSSLKHILVFL